ncbi:MAG: hypothetical protein GQ552_06960 [Flavobacteriaceae bacterium]|nr:hypothetical protein [Flavobacteriaceae bacterium]
MKSILFTFLIIITIYSCSSSQKSTNSSTIVPTNTNNDTIKIVNEELEYEILIIEIGFESWLVTQKPMWYYSNNTLAIKNQFYAIEWNQRVIQPLIYNPSLYEQQINYDPTIDYGIEVNYKLYMYFQFFQQKYKQKL